MVSLFNLWDSLFLIFLDFYLRTLDVLLEYRGEYALYCATRPNVATAQLSGEQDDKRSEEGDR